MTATPRNIIPSAYVSTSAATEYTAVNARALVQNMTVTNVTTAATGFSVHVVPSGDAVGAENALIFERRLQARETYDCPELAGKVLEAGDFIAVVADDGSAVVMNASGVEFS